MAHYDSSSALARLTQKHRECLDLALRQRMTSKQISRALNIAKSTVDQRMDAARRILGAADRDDTVVRYGQLLGIYDRVPYDPIDVPIADAYPHSGTVDSGLVESMSLEEVAVPYGVGQRFAFPRLTVLGVSIDELRSIPRLGIIAGLSLAIMLMMLVGLSIANTLDQLAAR